MPANSVVTVKTGHTGTDYFRYYGVGDVRNGAGVALLEAMPWWGNAALAQHGQIIQITFLQASILMEMLAGIMKRLDSPMPSVDIDQVAPVNGQQKENQMTGVLTM